MLGGLHVDEGLSSVLAMTLQHLDNVLGQGILDLSVAGNRLDYFRGGILIPVVLRTVPDQNTSHFG